MVSFKNETRDYNEIIKPIFYIFQYSLCGNIRGYLYSIGNQSGGRVFLFLNTDDFWRDYHRMVSAGVNFVRPPTEQAYGLVAVFEDLYGNLWDLLQLNPSHPIAERE
ncbi:VOC family protein [Spartinivicinus sp. SM1973]|nr:VOC family protein [Spartinivicinus marinus]